MGDTHELTLPDGRRMTQRDWDAQPHVLGVFLNGDAITEPDPRGQPVRDDSFLLLFSADSQPHRFRMSVQMPVRTSGGRPPGRH